ncbi:MAG: LysR family transcriptional regulator [Thauera sp.]|nr:LysR family transcriptional regulator [Thauera sp.]
MTPNDLNFRHLLYFWAVAKEGSITRAAARLNLSVQTISTQLSLLESQLGRTLFAPQGRSLGLTDAGRIVLGHAEQIFQLADKLRHALAESRNPRPRLAVGLTDTVPKVVAFRLLEGVLRPPLEVRLECSEGHFEYLLGELALNRLDLMLADQPAPQRANLRLQSELLGEAEIDLFATSPLRERYADDFPAQLTGAPILLPARGNPLRNTLDAWLEARNLQPVVVGEFSDSALMKTFARAGLGLFPAPANMRDEIADQYDAQPVGTVAGVRQGWHAISAQRRIPHPALAAIVAASARTRSNLAA